MSPTEDHAVGASGMAEQQVPGFGPGELRDGYAEIGDVRLHYVEASEGPLVVLLHDARPAFTAEETDRYVEAWSQPGAATGMINYYRSSVRQSQKKAEAALRPIQAPTLVIWGEQIATSVPNSPSPTRRRPQPGPRRAPARRLALGPPR